MSNQKKVFIVLLLIVTVSLLYLIRNFIGVISLSILIVLMFNPIYKWFLNKSKGNQVLSSTLTVFFVILSFLLPLIIVGVLTSYQILEVVSHLNESNFQSSDIVRITNNMIDQTNEFFESNSINYRITNKDVNDALLSLLQSVVGIFVSRITGIGYILPEVIADIILFIALISFLFPAQTSILNAIRKISPLSDEITKVYLNRMAAMARSMINGTFTIALIQGFIGCLTLSFVGVPYTLFFTLILIIVAIIPIIGSGIVLIPISIVLLFTENIFGAIIILLVQFIIISNIDNVLRPKLVEEDARLPEAVTLLGIMAGIGSFGPLGLIFGPVIMVVVYTTYDIYLKYYAVSIKNYFNRD